MALEKNVESSNDTSKQIEVCLHTEKTTITKETSTPVPSTLSSQILSSTVTCVGKDKQNKTTNIPSNCSTAIMIPVSGAKINCDCFEQCLLENKPIQDITTANIGTPSSDSTILNNGIDCER